MAATKAVTDSGMDLDKLDRDASACFIGSGIGGMETIEDQQRCWSSGGRAGSRRS